jgi:hypothetical protein
MGLARNQQGTNMPVTTLRTLRESLDIARYAATPAIVEGRVSADPAWLNKLRALVLGLLASIDLDLEASPATVSDDDRWSDDEQRLFGQWLRRTHPNLPSDAVIALGDAWKDGLRTGIARASAQPVSAKGTP